MQVDRELVLQPQRGWQDPLLPAPAGLPLRPVRSKLRRVYGISPTTGRRGYAIVSNVRAALWSTEGATFDVETNESEGDELIDTMVVTRRVGESFAVSR